MRRKSIAFAAAAMIGLAAITVPNKAEAYGRGWWIPGAVIGGLAAGAIISGAYGYSYYNPCCYYYPRPVYYYYYGPEYYYTPYYYRPYRHYWRPRDYGYYRSYPRYRYYRHRHYYRHHY